MRTFKTMMNKDFYPTPRHLIVKMLEPYRKEDSYYEYSKLEELCVLEPSAGKGDIVDFISEKIRNQTQIKVIEKNLDLQATLKGKDYVLIDEDFLTFESDYFFDLIIMNPPFSNGDEHLLKAIEIAKDTKIICLLNAETIRNPYTKKRQLLIEKINQFGSYEFLKEEFITAERKTSVEVALVRLDIKDESNPFEFNFKDFDEDKKIDFNFDFMSNQLATQDLISNMNLRFEEIRASYIDYLKAEAKFKHFRDLLIKDEHRRDITKKEGSAATRYNYVSERLKSYMWKVVIKELDIQKHMSSKVQNNFQEYIHKQSNMSFTKENVFAFFQLIMNNRTNILGQAVIDVFDIFTSYYPENRNHIEGWHTNDRYMVNRKVILPHWVTYGEFSSQEGLKSYGDRFKISYTNRTKYNDIDKVMAYLCGDSLEQNLTIEYALNNRFNEMGKIRTGDKFHNTCSSKYFNIKFFKKGTIHLEFKDKDLWRRFNLTVCEGKNWLPDNEKTKWEQEKKERRKRKASEQQDIFKPLIEV